MLHKLIVSNVSECRAAIDYKKIQVKLHIYYLIVKKIQKML